MPVEEQDVIGRHSAQTLLGLDASGCLVGRSALSDRDLNRHNSVVRSTL